MTSVKTNILEVARQYNCAVFFPSSIGAFGPSTPRIATPQVTVQRPTTMYGVTKVSGELLCEYYAARFGVDTRGLRLPGLISHTAPPGGGTTDYAVEIFGQAMRYRHYTCYLGPATRLDMMYMPDAIRAMVELMEADPTRLTNRNAYNVTAMSVTPQEIAARPFGSGSESSTSTTRSIQRVRPLPIRGRGHWTIAPRETSGIGSRNTIWMPCAMI